MAETLDGLFGPSAYDVEQARNKQALDYAAQVAAMNNLQQAKLGIGQGAAGITRGAAGMFGLVDPKVEQAKMREGVMGMGGDLSTSAGLKAKAAQFAAAGDQVTAMKLLMAARAQEAKEQAMAVELRKQDLAERKQTDVETEGRALKRMQIEAVIRQADERIADKRTSEAERIAAMREKTQAYLMLGQIENAIKQSAADAKATGKKSLSATAQKELFEADEAVMGANAGVKAIDEALSINKKAMGFKGAGLIADVGSVLPDVVRPKAFDATQDLDNIVQQSVLPQMKSIFGANPTEGERKILLEVSGSSSKPAPVREGIFKRARAMAENRARFNAEKAAKLRSGEYFNGAATDEPTVAEVQSAPQQGWSIKKK